MAFWTVPDSSCVFLTRGETSRLPAPCSAREERPPAAQSRRGATSQAPSASQAWVPCLLHPHWKEGSGRANGTCFFPGRRLSPRSRLLPTLPAFWSYSSAKTPFLTLGGTSGGIKSSCTHSTHHTYPKVSFLVSKNILSHYKSYTKRTWSNLCIKRTSILTNALFK